MTTPRVTEEMVERVARIIDPTSFSLTPRHYGLQTREEFRRTMAYGAQLTAIRRARAVLSSPDIAQIEAVAYGRGEVAMRERAVEECRRHAKFCHEEAHRGGDFKHLMTRCDEATYSAERIQALAPKPEDQS